MYKNFVLDNTQQWPSGFDLILHVQHALQLNTIIFVKCDFKYIRIHLMLLKRLLYSNYNLNIEIKREGTLIENKNNNSKSLYCVALPYKCNHWGLATCSYKRHKDVREELSLQWEGVGIVLYTNYFYYKLDLRSGHADFGMVCIHEGNLLPLTNSPDKNTLWSLSQSMAIYARSSPIWKRALRAPDSGFETAICHVIVEVRNATLLFLFNLDAFINLCPRPFRRKSKHLPFWIQT